MCRDGEHRHSFARNDAQETHSTTISLELLHVRNILRDESYTGILFNHKAEIRNGKKIDTEESTWLRHEGWYPVIICRENWERTQELMKKQARQAWGNRPKHRYAGLLRCVDCGNTFVL